MQVGETDTKHVISRKKLSKETECLGEASLGQIIGEGLAGK